MIQATKALTAAPFNVNFFCHKPTIRDADKERKWLAQFDRLLAEFGVEPKRTLATGYHSFLSHSDAMTSMLVDEHPHVVSFHFGLPSKECITALRRAGTVTLACVTSAEGAALAVDAGVDALVAQGYEAGGHRGVFDPSQDKRLGTFALLQLIARAVRSMPIISAGGIMNGQGVAALLGLGAAGVQLGTAFILCTESSADQAFREALQSDRAYRTSVSASISGRPARGMVNRVFTDLPPSDGSMPSYPLPYDVTKALDKAAQAAGSTEFAVQWAGQAAPLARALSAADLVLILEAETEAARKESTGITTN